MSPQEVTGPDLSRRQQRELGILPRQVLFRARQMAKDGELTEGMTPLEMAFCYIASVASSQEYGSAWRQVLDGTYGVNWDKIIELVSTIFEWLIKLLPIFI